MHQSLAWALDHDPPAALRLAIALAPWWALRGRLVAGYGLLRAAAAHATPGEEAWCAAQLRLGSAAFSISDFAGSVSHYTAARDALAARVLAVAAPGLGPVGQVDGAGSSPRRLLSAAPTGRQARAND